MATESKADEKCPLVTSENKNTVIPDAKFTRFQYEEGKEAPMEYQFEFGGESCLFCNKIPSISEVSNYRTTEWHQQLREFAKKLITLGYTSTRLDNLVYGLDREYVPKDKDYPKLDKDAQLFVESKRNDPFFDLNYTDLTTRYVALIVQKEYPNKSKFTVRGFYYRILSRGYCWFKIPTNTSTKLTLNRLKASLKTYNSLAAALRHARYAGLVPFEQVIEGRASTNIEPKDIPFVVNENQGIVIDAKVSLGIENIVPAIVGPLVVIFTEKSTYEPFLKEISEHYRIAYYIGMGQASVSTPYMIYQYIKKYSKVGIVLTFTDFDKQGLEMAPALYRKIQFIAAKDSSDHPDSIRPIILGKHWMMTDVEADECRRAEIPPMEKESKSKGKVFAYEIDALEGLIGLGEYDRDADMTHLLIRKLRKTLYKEFSIDLEDYRIDTDKSQNAKEFVFKQIQEQSQGSLLSESTDFDDMVKGLTEKITESQSFKELQSALKYVHIPKDIIYAKQDITDKDGNVIQPMVPIKTTDNQKVKANDENITNWIDHIEQGVFRIDQFDKKESKAILDRLNKIIEQPIPKIWMPDEIDDKIKTFGVVNDDRETIKFRDILKSPYEAITRWLNKVVDEKERRPNGKFEEDIQKNMAMMNKTTDVIVKTDLQEIVDDLKRKSIKNYMEESFKKPEQKKPDANPD